MWNNVLSHIVKYLTPPAALFDVKWNLPTFAPANISHLRSKYFTAKLFHLPARANFVEKSTCRSKCFFLAPPAGLEPATSWLTVMRSTDWAKEEYKAQKSSPSGKLPDIANTSKGNPRRYRINYFAVRLRENAHWKPNKWETKLK